MSNQKRVDHDSTDSDQEEVNHPVADPSHHALKSEEPANTPTIGQLVLDRLNSHVRREKLGGTPEPAKKYLGKMGSLIRAWRIKNGYVRADLAKKLNLEEDRLLCIEREIGLPEDITEEQLLMLESLLETNELDRQLKTLIQNYLTSLKR